MKNKEVRTISNKTKITYRQVGDFKFPNIILPLEQGNITLGNGVCECRWHSNRRTDRAGRRDMMHKNHLEHNIRGLFMIMITKCALWPYLADIDRQARRSR